MKIHFLILTGLLLISAGRAFASGCVTPDYRVTEESRTQVSFRLLTDAELGTSAIHVFKYPNGQVQILASATLQNAAAGESELSFVTPVFDAGWISPGEVIRFLQAGPQVRSALRTTRIYEVVNDPSDCIEVGTTYRQSQYEFRVEFGRGDDIRLTATGSFIPFP